ncbi:MAG: Holliday junction resolvase-like protein [Candidatus Aenigmatarchaeota archaeon]
MLIAFLIILLFISLILLSLYLRALEKIKEITSEKQSILVKHGKALEQFIPFIESYPFDKTRFRFIGSPIDGIQFEDDKIIFVEFKTGDAKLTEEQKKIKELIENKRVEFLEFRV